jgi:hypothetical protein
VWKPMVFFLILGAAAACSSTSGGSPDTNKPTDQSFRDRVGNLDGSLVDWRRLDTDGRAVDGGKRDNAVSGTTFAWVRTFGGVGDESGTDIVVSPSGDHVFMVGEFYQPVDFGGGAIPNFGNTDIFLASFTATGQHRWSQAFGSEFFDWARATGVDSKGNVYLAGTIYGFAGGLPVQIKVNFGGGALISGGSSDGFLASFSSSGSHRWSKAFGSVWTEANGLAFDGSDNVFLAGSIEGSTDFGGGAITPKGPDQYLASFTPSGGYRSAKDLGTVNEVSPFVGVALDTAGNLYLTGEFSGVVDFGGGQLASKGKTDVFVASFTSNGAHRWSKSYGDVDDDAGVRVVVDAQANVLVMGHYIGSIDFGGGKITTSSSCPDLFLAGFTSDGQHRWSKGFAGCVRWDAGDLALDPAGNLCLTTGFSGSMNMGGGPLPQAGGWDILVASFTSAGAHRWSTAFGGTASDAGTGIAVDGGGGLYVTGYFQNTVLFGSELVTSAGRNDVFLLKLTP